MDLRLRLVSVVVASAVATLVAAPADGQTPTPTLQQLEQSVAQLNGGLSQQASQISTLEQELAEGGQASSDIGSACGTGGSMVMPASASEFLGSGSPAPGSILTAAQCDSVSNAVESLLASDEQTLQSWTTIAEQLEALLSAVLQTINQIEQDLGRHIVSVSISPSPSPSGASVASDSESSTLSVTAHGRGLRSVRISFDGRQLTTGRGERAEARIGWAHAKPGVHLVRISVQRANGHRLVTYYVLLKHNPAFAKRTPTG
jgi:prefoldin subunit 5